ncbi:MAG TPA: hypothetical protein VFX03_02705, partial [Thermomicrobiales bacterium]|nr:hypothetical protein [Thermomicrobiales bacterium]
YALLLFIVERLRLASTFFVAGLCRDCADCAGLAAEINQVRAGRPAAPLGCEAYAWLMTSQKVPAILMVDEHLIVGEVQTRGKRLLETLNDPLADWLQVYDAHVARREAKATCLETLDELAVRKSRLVLALLDGRKHEAPETRRFAFVDKKLHSAFAVAAGYDVRGRLHVKGKAEPLAVLAETGAFVPLTDAVVSHAGVGGEEFKAAVAMINKAAISMLHIADVPEN